MTQHLWVKHFWKKGLPAAIALGLAASTPTLRAAPDNDAGIGVDELPPPPISPTAPPPTSPPRRPASTTQPAQPVQATTTSALVPIKSPVPYYIDRGVTMVPMRPLCSFLGINVTALDGLLTFSQRRGDADRMKLVTLRVGGRSAQIVEGGNTRRVALALPVETRLGNTFLPIRFVREAFGATVGFRARDNALVVQNGAQLGVLVPPPSRDYRGRGAAVVTITNRVGRALSLRLSGPQSLVLELGKGQSVTRRLKPGVYYYKAGSVGMKPRSGARRLHSNRRATWAWGRK